MCTFFFEIWKDEKKKNKNTLYFLFVNNILNYKFDKIQNCCKYTRKKHIYW